MNRNFKDLLREFAARTPKQEAYEIICLLLPLEKELNITVSNYFLLVHDDAPEFGAIPLDNIQLAIAAETHVFLVCCNGMIYSLDRRTHRHEIFLPDEPQPGWGEMFFLLCKNYIERWRERKI